MTLCWYCWWGWAKPVRDIYNAALADFDGDDSPLEWGPGHIVWSDANFDTESIDFCINACDEYSEDRLSRSDIDRIKQSLLDLRQIPEEIRCCQPSDYDGENPQLFPPNGVEVVR